MAKLVLVRHGQSLWNKKNVFTGWVDVPLSTVGIEEALKAGETLKDLEFDVVYTSVQVRALETAMIAMAKNKSEKTPVVIHPDGKMSEWGVIYSEEMSKNVIPVYRDWHLNERYYGELQGMNKAETAKTYGDEQVHIWRRSYDVPPPNGECLQDTAERTIPFFKENILKQLKEGKNVLVSAHGNSLRSIVMFIEELSKEEVLKLEIPTGVPLLFSYENDKLTRE
ncbi:2,3-bisphosphoglycerate-dependent phosphoglycerate mutase [Prolixibacter denitrificans]|uniref:2,3-bisphosphoglycerate-dependent phosphoglycerate mutase n=1 Tax=Prolixibacter denitrificans TaxID=1541063 RepID=A0A2P8CAH8_9BACT|nr:2,3-bisphosphoglycerate-dependent phosphoglycerate mutase [Prolixibacter denitrificans]PSK81932.1 2,3-bisphosphoglycerate-dependent phosphoglycerate mutase [Prolixibacter denitrificans]GET22529.1 2,3-bisphosphoglycerate-dependent phosphoglycerate mutase [Prolixibacter denitrificans]